MKKGKQAKNPKEAGFVAAELTRYFTHVGNQDVFRNGMSLSKVALSMEPFCYNESMGSSLSQIKNALRLFTPVQARAFCHVVGLNADEQLLLECALAKDLLSREEMDLAVVALAPTLNLVIKNLHRVDEAIHEDKLAQALSILCDIFQWKDEMGNETYASPYVIRIHTFISIERQRLIQRIAQQGQSILLSGIELVDSSPTVDVVGELDTETRLQLVLTIDNPTVSLTPLEQQVWNGIYRYKQSLPEIAESLSLQPGTVQSIQKNIEQRIVIELVHQLRTAQQLS